jgi:hypothetical protein
VLSTNGVGTTSWITIGGGGGAVDSVNGQTGVVVLDTDDISEGSTNLYYTDTRVGTYLSANLNFSEAPITQITGNTNLTDAHANRFLECINGGAITLSISAGIRRSAEIVVMQASTGAVTIAAGAGVTLRNTTSFTNLTAEQYALIGLKQLGTTNVWVITGERKTA